MERKKPLPRALIACFLGTLVGLGSCGGGGGGGGGSSTSSVHLTKAVFQGSSVSDTDPSPGETLLLYFDGDITLVSGAILDDNDVQLSGSLGQITSAPTMVDARTIQVTLGSGVNFTVGSSTLDLASGQDVLQDGNGLLLAPDNGVTITNSDGDRPSIDSMTLNDIPSLLNGEGAAGGTLQVPPSGFSLDLTYSDPSSAIDTSSLVITSSVAVTASGNNKAAGTNLISFFSGSPGSGSASLSVPSSLVFPTGSQTLTVTIADATGNFSSPRSFNLTVHDLTDALRPFETSQNSQQLWFIETARDLDSLGSSTTNGGTTIDLSASTGANGTSDFVEELRVLGILTTDALAIPNVSGSKNSNEVSLDLLKTQILEQLAVLYQGVSISFTFTDPGGFPSGSASVLYANATHSRISLTGRSLSGVLGLAFFDPNNAHQEDDTLHPGSTPPSTQRLGVFLRTLTSSAINVSGSTFRLTFDSFIDHRGTPIGEDSGDKTRLQNLLAKTTGDSRQSAMDLAYRRLGRFLAVVLAHECGHSMGLVQDGAQPTGLYGGDSVNFPGSSTGHISLASSGLFGASAQEVMEPSLSFTKSLDSGTAFNDLLKAYLKETCLYGN